MLLPNQITAQRFSPNGKGGYKAIEVDAFLQRVSQSYSKLYSDNGILNDRLDSIVPQLEEYNRNKSSIADALIWAKATSEKNIDDAKAAADKLIAEATEQAEQILNEKKNEAEKYYTETTEKANKELAEAQAEFDLLKQESDSYREAYITDVTEKTDLLIREANNKASTIIAEAYAEAQQAKDRVDEIVASANNKLIEYKAQAEQVRQELFSLISVAQKAAECVTESDFSEIIPEQKIIEAEDAPKLDIEEIEQFTFEGAKNVFSEEQAEEELPKQNAFAFADFEEIEEIADEASKQPEYVKFFGADMPDVNEYLAGIFNAVSADSKQSESNISFADLFSHSEDDSGLISGNRPKEQ